MPIKQYSILGQSHLIELSKSTFNAEKSISRVDFFRFGINFPTPSFQILVAPWICPHKGYCLHANTLEGPKNNPKMNLDAIALYSIYLLLRVIFRTLDLSAALPANPFPKT